MSNTEHHVSLLKKLAEDRHIVTDVSDLGVPEMRHFGSADTGIAPVWFDRRTGIMSEDGKRAAYRAITIRGELHWVVFTEGRTRAQSCRTHCPYIALNAVRQVSPEKTDGRREWAA